MGRKIEENKEDRMSSNEEVSITGSENEAENGYEADSFVVEDDSESEYQEDDEVLKPRVKKPQGIKKKKTKLVDDLEEDMEAIDKAKMT